MNLEKINGAPAEFGLWAQETPEKSWSYPFVVYKFFMEHPDDSDDPVEWCEYNLETTACTEDICRVCSVNGIYYALHPLSRDHIFIGPELVQMKSELNEIFA